MPTRITVEVRHQRGVPFPDFAAIERRFLVELGRLVQAIILPKLRRVSRRQTGELMRSWRVVVNPLDGLPQGISAVFYWTVQGNKEQFFQIINRELPPLVRRAARVAVRG